MIIYVSAGYGYGRTLLSSFDFALMDTGVYNYNLITLSSVIPPGSVIKKKKFKASKNEYGHKLYIVKADKRSNETGKYIGAALGWYQAEDNRGVFVEHDNIDYTSQNVEVNLRQDVERSLRDLCSSRNFHFKKQKMGIKTKVIKVEDRPACVLVLAVYKAESWEQKETILAK